MNDISDYPTRSGILLDCRNFLGSLQKTDFKTNKNKTKTTGRKGANAENKSGLKTNETLITQVTNALFYKVDKRKLQLAGFISVPMQELIQKQNIKQKQH